MTIHLGPVLETISELEGDFDFVFIDADKGNYDNYYEAVHVEVAQRYIARSAHAEKITIHLGPALETISELEGDFDFVFIDADK
ncbi:MAG: hypothetical protein H0U07_02850, partial [Actinobacteria bacterium]|nr:hypothetical protein [Actinomycetota bacterium]